MCGIAGIFDRKGRRPIDRDLLRRMTSVLAHRGPDGSGHHVAPGVGLGHRRLAIIDVAGGHQPLFNEDETVAITFNGEIYNFEEIATELAHKGHLFRTRSDTEAIVHAWEEWGEDCVTRLRGMFAFAIWDQNRETLFLARDRLGKKPLYYAELDDGLVLFGSELKALLVHPELRRDIDPTAVEDYFAYGYVPESKSIYRTVRKLAPAHSMRIVRGRTLPVPRRYWDLSFVAGKATLPEAAEELFPRLREAVALRLISEVPLGAFLSGGVDSSAVVAAMAQSSNEPVNSFSIGFGNRDFDESEYARRVAEQYRTRHRLRMVDPDAFDLVGRLARTYDEPFADSSAIPTYRLCAATREHVTVALSGDGGDELFAGYRRYAFHGGEEAVRAIVPAFMRRPLFGALGRLYPKADWAPRRLRAKQTFLELAEDSLNGYFLNVSMNGDPLRERLYTPAFRRDLQGYHAREELARFYESAPADDPVSRAQYADIKTYLAGDILTKVDRASMANSLEVRAPLLDHRFVEWAATLPVGHKLHGNDGKHVFKKALLPHLPEDLLYRRKQGFSVPLAAWFRGPLRESLGEALTRSALADTGWFDTRFIGKAYEQHVSGLRDHSTLLWSLLMFDGFLNEVHAKERAPLAEGPRIDRVA